MNEKEQKRISKFLSLVLRHQPELIGLELDKNGWANTADLIEKSTARKVYFTHSDLQEIVATNDKKRFSFNDDENRIRANQGHSIKNIDLEMKTKQPPHILYHGTVEKFIPSIRKKGLVKGSRQHVHLSKDLETARNVGSRRGNPIILKIDGQRMGNEGYIFYLSENNVWLTDHVPVKYINFS